MGDGVWCGVGWKVEGGRYLVCNNACEYLGCVLRRLVGGGDEVNVCIHNDFTRLLRFAALETALLVQRCVSIT